MGASVYLSKPGVLCAAGSNADELWNSVTDGKQDGIRKVTALNGKTFFAGRTAPPPFQIVRRRFSQGNRLSVLRLAEKCIQNTLSELQKRGAAGNKLRRIKERCRLKKREAGRAVSV